MKKVKNKSELSKEIIQHFKNVDSLFPEIFDKTKVIFNIIIKNTEDKTVEKFEIYEV